MITPRKIQEIADPVEGIYINCVNELMVNIGKHITSPTWTHTASWEIQKLSEMGQLTKENAEIINKWIKQIPPAMRSTMEATRAAALDRLEQQMENAVKDGAIQPPLADSTVQVFKDYADQAVEKMNMVNTTMLQSTLAQYQRAIALTEEIVQQAENTQATLNEAAGSVLSGVETRTKAMQRAIKKIGDEGLTGFYDRAGRSWTPEAYVNMVIRTTVHNTAIQATQNRMQDYGTDVFQISSHAGARPLCYPFQGWFCSWSNRSGEIELGDGSIVSYHALNETSYGQPAGIFGINCGHYPIPIIEGYTIPHGADNIQPEEENDKAYALSQEQRALERQIRAAKRVVEMGDTSDEAKQAVKDAQAKMRQFIAETGRTRRYDRESLYGSSTRTQNTQPKQPSFTPAKTIQEAEEYAKRFTDDGRFGAVGISYTGIDLDVANRVNKTLGSLYDRYDVEKFGGIVAPAGNTKLGQAIQGATAAYSPIRNSFLLNRKRLKNEQMFLTSIAEDQKAIKDYLANPDKYDLSKARKVIAIVLQNAKTSGRGTVPETIEEAIDHEFGHVLEKSIKKMQNADTLKERMTIYAGNISGYAATDFGEYIAESFASYMKGEKRADPMMIAAFKSLERG